MTKHSADSTKLRESAAAADRRAAESFDRCDTDGFVSQWASGMTAQRDRLAADVLDAGGVATFFRYQLTDLDGEPVAAKLIDGRYGPCWAMLDDDDSFTGVFVSAHPKRSSTIERKGYREQRVYFVAPAVARLRGSGRGLSGAASVRAVVTPAESGVRYDGVEGIGDQLDEIAADLADGERVERS